jgi:hypothetical protein
MSRREALVWLGAAYTVVEGTLSISGNLLTITKAASEGLTGPNDALFRDDRRKSIIRQTFFSDLRGQIPMVPGFDHKHWLQREGVNPDDDIAAVQSINSLFPRSPGFQIVSPTDHWNAASGLICAGSPISNNVAAEAISNNIIDSHGTIRTANGPYQLAYVHRQGDDHDIVERFLNTTWVREANHLIVAPKSGRIYGSMLDADRQPRTAYLLYSKVPHPYQSGHTAVIWAGNIGPATESVRLLFETRQYMSDQDIQNIADFANEHVYFQALFRVEDIQLSPAAGRHIATMISLEPDGLQPVRPVS